VGALDVAPIVHRTDAERGAATAEALLLAHRLGRDLGLPVYLYGTLAGGRARATLRAPGALAGLAPD
jgi:glutamate formiminotransferase